MKLRKVLGLLFAIVLFASTAFAAVAVKDSGTYEGEVTTLNFGTGIDGALSGSTYSLTPSASQIITGGTIDGAAIGGSTPAAGAFTTLSSSGAATLATVDGVLGSVTPAAISGTTISSSGAATLATVDGILGSVTPAAITATSITATSARINSFNFAADTAVDDDYLIAPSPAFTAYAAGNVIIFTAVTANTGACTVDVNGLGAKALLMLNDQVPGNNYIEAGSVVMAVYDGTSFQMVQPAAN